MLLYTYGNHKSLNSLEFIDSNKNKEKKWIKNKLKFHFVMYFGVNRKTSEGFTSASVIKQSFNSILKL